MSIKEQVLNLLRSGAAMTAGGTILATGAYILYKDQTRYTRMEQSFSRGNILAPFIENQYESSYFKRRDIETMLEVALKPSFSNEYYLVSGEVGSGKTRTIVEMVRQMMTTRGTEGLGAPIYVSVTQGKSFADSLASAIQFFYDEHISFKFFIDFVLRIHSFPERDDHHKLVRVLDALESAAFQYMQKTGRPVVLVIDGANTMALKTPQVLERLQAKAKLWADTNIIKVIFVSNDENTEILLQEHSSHWSRAAAPLCVGDLSEAQSIQFLTNSHLLETDQGTDKSLTFQQAIHVHNLVGGRVHHLLAFKRDQATGIPFETTAEELKSKEFEKFMAISKSSTTLKLVNMLKRSSQTGISLSKLIDASSERHVGLLMKYNIIRIERRGTGMVAMFASKLTENVANAMVH